MYCFLNGGEDFPTALRVLRCIPNKFQLRTRDCISTKRFWHRPIAPVASERQFAASRYEKVLSTMRSGADQERLTTRDL